MRTFVALWKGAGPQSTVFSLWSPGCQRCELALFTSFAISFLVGPVVNRQRVVNPLLTSFHNYQT